MKFLPVWDSVWIFSGIFKSPSRGSMSKRGGCHGDFYNTDIHRLNFPEALSLFFLLGKYFCFSFPSSSPAADKKKLNCRQQFFLCNHQGLQEYNRKSKLLLQPFLFINLQQENPLPIPSMCLIFPHHPFCSYIFHMLF